MREEKCNKAREIGFTFCLVSRDDKWIINSELCFFEVCKASSSMIRVTNYIFYATLGITLSCHCEKWWCPMVYCCFYMCTAYMFNDGEKVMVKKTNSNKYKSVCFFSIVNISFNFDWCSVRFYCMRNKHDWNNKKRKLYDTEYSVFIGSSIITFP